MRRELLPEQFRSAGMPSPARNEDCPGKRTLSEAIEASSSSPRRATGTEHGPSGDETSIQAAAARGIATPASALPHGASIQQLFGRHDISSIQAHLAPGAAASARDLGAQAYATGDHVVFDGSPDLHTAAHEAAHVVQQRAGVQRKSQLDQPGDRYEAHADRVADLVVQGRSAESALDEVGGGSGGGSGGRTVQRKLQTDLGILAKDSDSTVVGEYVRKFGQGDPVREHIIRSMIEAPERLFTETDLEHELVESYQKWLEVVGGQSRTQKPEDRRGLIRFDERGGERLRGWLAEPAAFKEQTGGDKHRQLLAHVVQDLRQIQGWLADLDDKTVAERLHSALVERLPAVLLYLVHNSSHDPPHGLAKVQATEASNPLYYYRSQSKRKHPHEVFYFQLLEYVQTTVLDKVSGSVKKDRGMQRLPATGEQILPSEPAMKKLTADNVGSGAPLSVATAWSAKDVNGTSLFFTKTRGYKGDTAAQVGMRKTNAQVYSDGLRTLFAASGSLADGIGHLIAFLQRFYAVPDAPADELPPTEQVMAELNQVCVAIDKLGPELGAERPASSRSKDDHGRGNDDHSTPEVGGERGSLFDESLAYRGSFAEALARAMSQVSLSHLTVFTFKDHPNLAIQTGAPPLTSAKTYSVAASYHEEGWTNAVLSFFGGLLNHFAAVHGQAVYVTRRQSFGFLRPTLTDTKESFRLSLGAQPVGYADVILEALCHLEAAISSLAPDIAARALLIVEKKGKDGDRVMRYLRSDSQKAMAYATAQHFAAQGVAGSYKIVKSSWTMMSPGSPIVALPVGTISIWPPAMARVNGPVPRPEYVPRSRRAAALLIMVPPV